MDDEDFLGTKAERATIEGLTDALMELRRREMGGVQKRSGAPEGAGNRSKTEV